VDRSAGTAFSPDGDFAPPDRRIQNYDVRRRIFPEATDLTRMPNRRPEALDGRIH
jgi:hypothetical protein